MAETVQFPNIFVSGKVKGVAGTLQINKTGFAWKNSLGHKVNVLATELKKAFWFHVGPCCRIALTLKTGSFVRFEGLNTRDRETISAYIASNFKVQLENKELATKGWNWGKTQVENKILSFLSDNKVCFEVPLGDLSSVKSDKNDVILQFVQDETTKTIPELMVEMKLYVPPDLNAKLPSSSPKVVEDGEEAEEEEEEEEELPPAAENFKNLLLTHTTIRSGSSSSPLITSIPAINFFTPRGRLDLELYKTSFVFRGKGKDYQAPYSSILALSFLEISANNYLVVSLDPPIRQGNTSYQHLIASLKRSDQYNIEIAVDVASDEQKEDLEATMEGGPETILKIIKSITRKPLLKNGSFQSDAQEKCVRSSYKVNDGHLFPMEKYLFFVSKVPMMIAYDSIKLVSVHRLSKVNQSFDLKLQLKDDPAPITFSSIQKTESRNLIKFLGGRGLNISSDEDPSLGVAAPKLTDIDDDSEEEDDDFDPDAVSEDDGEYDDEDDDDEYNSGDDGEVDVPPTDDDDDDGASSAPPKKRLRDSPSSSSSSSSSAPPSKRARTSKDDDDDDL